MTESTTWVARERGNWHALLLVALLSSCDACNNDGDGDGDNGVVDAGADAGDDAGQDAGKDAGADAGDDAGQDAGQDAGATCAYAGHFKIDVTVVSNDCDVQISPYGQSTPVMCSGSEFFFFSSSTAGTWDESTKTGSGTVIQTIPIIPGSCTGTSQVDYVLTFSDTDHFTGTHHEARTYTAGCPDPTPCTIDYSLSGTRI